MNHPFSIYVHLPWCVRRCLYCDFNAHQIPQTPPFERYVEKINTDLRTQSVSMRHREVMSVFFGGGTPSLFHPNWIHSIIQTIRHCFHTNHSMEITLEANPGTKDQDFFMGYRASGVSRLSIGIQSFQPHLLQSLGRIHCVEDAYEAIEIGKTCLFPHLNIDVMYGLPNQTDEEMKRDLIQAHETGVDHLSYYQLTLEPGTFFAKHPPPLPSHDGLADHEAWAFSWLKDHGWNRYEISAYTQHQPCLHNLNYWMFGDYLGIGAGAHSKITYEDRIERMVWKRSPDLYLKQSSPEIRSVSPRDAVTEFFMNRWRLLNHVIDLDDFERMTHVDRKQLPIILKNCEPYVRLSDQQIEFDDRVSQYLNEWILRLSFC